MSKFYTSNLEGYFHALQDNMDTKYHPQVNAFPDFDVSADDMTELASLASYATHSGGRARNPDLYVDGIHIERLIT